MPNRLPARNERGMTLVWALLSLILLALSIAGALLSLEEGPLGPGSDRRGSPARSLVQAGVAEARARLRAGAFPDSGDPRMELRFALAAPEAGPGADSITLVSCRPAARALAGGTGERGEATVTVRYMTDPTRTRICRFDPTRHPAIQTSTGPPIFTITSCGASGADRLTIATDVVLRPFHPEIQAKAAVVCDADLDLDGSLDVCGRNHLAGTPPGASVRQRCRAYEAASGHLPGAWSCGAVSAGGSSIADGDPPILEHQAGACAGPWECLGLSRQRFREWIGPPTRIMPSPLGGIVHLGGDASSRSRERSFALAGGSGAGLLYVDGDLALRGDFTYVGLVYVEGDLQVSGSCEILGGLVVRGRSGIRRTAGRCRVLYSADSIRQSLAAYGAEITTLSWREER